jgi:mono/diheme cytochrome c family protein
MGFGIYVKSWLLGAGLMACFTTMAPIAQQFEGSAVGNMDRGREIVESNCAGCHAGPSNEVLSTFGGPPSLEALAQRVLSRSGYHQAFESRSHALMPKFFFNETSIEDIKAYIESLR